MTGVVHDGLIVITISKVICFAMWILLELTYHSYWIRKGRKKFRSRGILIVVRVKLFKNYKNPTVSMTFTLLTRNLADNFPYFHTAGKSSLRMFSGAPDERISGTIA